VIFIIVYLSGELPFMNIEPLLLLYYALLLLLTILSLGGIAYYLIAIFASRKLTGAKSHARETSDLPRISLLKPLSGMDSELEQCVESFFRQDYPSFEILFAVREASDPAINAVNNLTARYPQVATRLIITGKPPYANAKVYSMEKMAEAASGPILVVTDSDASVAPNYLQVMADNFAASDVGAVTNLYRGIASADLWSKLEALGMSTEFMAGVVVADRLEGMKFTLGPSMAIRADCLRKIGGFAAMADYLADDFVLGQWVAQSGYIVKLSTHVINHHASATGFINSFKHRLRWNRSTRFSRPSGYIGQGFTYGLAWSIMLALAAPALWTLIILLATLAIRGWLTYELAVRLLNDRAVASRWWLIPLQDLLSLTTWIGGFLGREIVWRNERYLLLEGGRFAPITPRQ
jgi:ceramide glucosyltransferase